jgi:hypothetical protein
MITTKRDEARDMSSRASSFARRNGAFYFSTMTKNGARDTFQAQAGTTTTGLETQMRLETLVCFNFSPSLTTK